MNSGNYGEEIDMPADLAGWWNYVEPQYDMRAGELVKGVGLSTDLGVSRSRRGRISRKVEVPEGLRHRLGEYEWVALVYASPETLPNPDKSPTRVGEPAVYLCGVRRVGGEYQVLGRVDYQPSTPRELDALVRDATRGYVLGVVEGLVSAK